jgi:hypothetical protein
MRLLPGGNTRSPAPRPNLTGLGPRTAHVTPDGLLMKTITGVRVIYYDPVVVFLNMSDVRRGVHRG